MSEEPKPKLEDVRDRFLAYLARHVAWGSLHVAFDDGNIDDEAVEVCLEHALRDGDDEGAALARILLQLTEDERLELADL